MANTSNRGQDVERINEPSVARFARILNGDVPRIETIGILTAANPFDASTAQHRNRGLYQNLLTYGIRQMKGRYGRMENPYLVANITRERIVELGITYNQDSVIFGRCERAKGGVRFELVSTSSDQSGQPPVGTVISVRQMVLAHVADAAGPDEQAPAFLEDEDSARRAGSRGDDGENSYGEYGGRHFVIPFFDDDCLRSEYRGSPVLNYYRHEIPRTVEAQQILDRFLARARALQKLLSTLNASGHALHDRRGDQNLRLIELHELMGGWRRFPLFSHEEGW